MPTEPRNQTHLNIYDAAARQQWAHRFGVTGERLRKAVTMVGSCISTIADYLGQPAPEWPCSSCQPCRSARSVV